MQLTFGAGENSVGDRGDRGDNDHVTKATSHSNSSLCTILILQICGPCGLLKYMHHVEKIYECDSLPFFLWEMTWSGTWQNVVLPYLDAYKWCVNLWNEGSKCSYTKCLEILKIILLPESNDLSLTCLFLNDEIYS